jgi:hypothetical protein
MVAMNPTNGIKKLPNDGSGLHLWLHERVLELMSLREDPIEMGLGANGFRFP